MHNIDSPLAKPYALTFEVEPQTKQIAMDAIKDLSQKKPVLKPVELYSYLVKNLKKNGFTVDTQKVINILKVLTNEGYISLETNNHGVQYKITSKEAMPS